MLQQSIDGAMVFNDDAIIIPWKTEQLENWKNWKERLGRAERLTQLRAFFKCGNYLKTARTSISNWRNQQLKLI